MSTATATGSHKSKASGAGRTRTEHAEHGFIASARYMDDMQRVLVDLLELRMQAKQAHWNVVGKNFRDLHLQLDTISDEARTFSDTIAERMRALHGVPDGRSTTVSKATSLEEYPAGEVDTAVTVDLITNRLEAAVGTIREVHDEVEEEDATTADIFHDIIARFEQLAWMVSAENRKPS